MLTVCAFLIFVSWCVNCVYFVSVSNFLDLVSHLIPFPLLLTPGKQSFSLYLVSVRSLPMPLIRPRDPHRAQHPPSTPGRPAAPPGISGEAHSAVRQVTRPLLTAPGSAPLWRRDPWVRAMPVPSDGGAAFSATPSSWWVVAIILGSSVLRSLSSPLLTRPIWCV